MKSSSNLAIVILLILLISSGLEQRILYLFFPVVGFITLYQDKFRIQISEEIKYSFIAILLLFLIFLIQSLFSYKGIFSIQGFLRYLSYFFLLIFIRRLESSTLRLFLYFFALLIVISIPFGVYVSFIRDGRYQFFFNHSNHLAYVCVLMSFYFLKVYTGKSYKKKIFISLFGAIILFTKSTGGLLSYAFLILYSIYTSRKSICG